MKLLRPSATSYSVETLVDLAWSGSLRVPSFQREFRWGFEDVKRLLDSISHGYPIGNLLLWQKPAPAQQLTLGQVRVDAPEDRAALWVVDGQQRLTSLANALHPRIGRSGRFALAYDLQRQEFIKLPQSPVGTQIPLPVLFDLAQLLKWFSESAIDPNLVDRANKMTQQLRQYVIPAYIVASDDEAVLTDIFDRMNNYGKRLTRAEVFAALHSNQPSSDWTFRKIVRDLHNATAFGVLDENTVLSALLATRGPDVKRDIRAEFDNDSEDEKQLAYEKTFIALQRAVDFLQREAGIPHLTFLPYKYLLVVLARYFAFFEARDARSVELLRRWLWRAAVVGPEHFRGGTPNAARILCGKIIEEAASQSETAAMDSIQRLLDSVPNRPPTRDYGSFQAGEATAKIFLCSLWARGPRDPSTGELYALEDLGDVIGDYSTATPAVVKIPGQAGARERRTAGSRVILPARTSPRVSREPTPAEQLTHLVADRRNVTIAAQDVLNSHGFDEIAKDANPWEERSLRVVRGAEAFVNKVGGVGLEDTPPLARFELDGEVEH